MLILTRRCWEILSLIRKETSYNDKTRDSFNILPMKINTVLFRCSNFCKQLKKNQNLSVQPGLRGSIDIRVGRKVANFHLFFQSREQVLVRRGQNRGISWVIKTLEAQVGQFLLGCKCPVSRGIVVQEQDTLGELPAAFFFKMSFSYTSRDE